MSKLNVSMSKEMEEVLEKAQREFGITKEQAFKRAFALLKVYTEEKSQNHTFRVYDENDKLIKIVE